MAKLIGCFDFVVGLLVCNSAGRKLLDAFMSHKQNGEIIPECPIKCFQSCFSLQSLREILRLESAVFHFCFYRKYLFCSIAMIFTKKGRTLIVVGHFRMKGIKSLNSQEERRSYQVI